MSDLVEADVGIRQLHAHYVDAVWRKDATAFGECFTEDAEWRISGMALRGRSQIVATIAQILAGANRILMTFRTPIIGLTGAGRASARTYVTEQCTWHHRGPNISIGRYYEHCVDEGDRWRFSWRLFQILYSGPEDLSGTFHDQEDYGPPPGMPPLDAVPAAHGQAKWRMDEPASPEGASTRRR